MNIERLQKISKMAVKTNDINMAKRCLKYAQKVEGKFLGNDKCIATQYEMLREDMLENACVEIDATANKERLGFILSLLKLGAVANYDQGILLAVPSKHDDLKLVKILIRFGADPEAYAGYAMGLALKNSSYNVIKYYVKKYNKKFEEIYKETKNKKFEDFGKIDNRVKKYLIKAYGE